MVPDDRSSTGGSAFDFNSQAGVLAVLGAIRASALSPIERNELRDLVFLYSNGGGDPAVRTMLEERLRENNITAVATSSVTATGAASATVVSKSTAGFASGRPMPVFTPAAPIAVPVVVPVPVVASPVPVPEPVIVPVPQPPVVPAPILTPAPASPVVEVVTVPVPVSAPVAVPAPVAPPVQSPVPVVNVPPAVSVPPVISSVPAAPTIVPTTPTPDPAPVVDPISPQTTERLERIRQIKSDVNNHVGNPVNLVTMNKVVGTEYMSALLESMKLLSSATDTDSARAMARLEAAYTQVQQVLDARQVPTAKPILSTMTEQSIVSASTESVSPVAPVMSQEKDATATQVWGEAASVAELAQKPIRVAPIAPVLPPLPVVDTNPITPVSPVASVSVSPVAVPVITPVSAVVPPVPTATAVPQFQSVAAAQAPLRTLSELPTADQVNSVSTNGDPLYTKEVDNGLNQLLSEWSLFKKSGLFGTGPSGREHPLFVKLSPLQIPLILTGRFEGATQEIKQSITDYMNGWRYEQGIVYEKDEVFDHYLRRVIRHIIDLQIAKRST